MKQFDTYAREAWCVCWVAAFIQHTGDTLFFANPARSYFYKMLERVKGLEQEPIQTVLADAEKLGKVVTSERGKNCSFLFKEILILCFDGSTILLGLIPDLCAPNPPWYKVTFVLTSPFPHVIEKRIDRFKVMAVQVISCPSVQTWWLNLGPAFINELIVGHISVIRQLQK